jgi:hypothetical protein
MKVQTVAPICSLLGYLGKHRRRCILFGLQKNADVPTILPWNNSNKEPNLDTYLNGVMIRICRS